MNHVVELRELMSEITFTVKGVCGMAWRVWIAVKLFRIAARVIGCNMIIERLK